MRNILNFYNEKNIKSIYGGKKIPRKKIPGWVGSYQCQILQSNEGQIFVKKLLNSVSKRSLATSRGIIVASKKHSVVPKTVSKLEWLFWKSKVLQIHQAASTMAGCPDLMI